MDRDDSTEPGSSPPRHTQETSVPADLNDPFYRPFSLGIALPNAVEIRADSGLPARGQDYTTEEEEEEYEEEEGYDSMDFEGSESQGFLLSSYLQAERNLCSAYPSLESYVPTRMENDLVHSIDAQFADISEGREAQSSRNTLLSHREIGLGGTPPQITRTAFQKIPNTPTATLDQTGSRAYIGCFSPDGDTFVGAFQDERVIKLYDANNNFKIKMTVPARDLRWTVTDLSLSPSMQFMVYSSISPFVKLVSLSDCTTEGGEEQHELSFADDSLSEGIWSLQWAGNNTDILAGSTDKSVSILDCTSETVVAKVKSHEGHVNAVEYADDTGNIFYSGSDDNFIHIWDRRTIGRGGKPVGSFIGHTEGIVHLSSKGDSRYVISNSKDQTIKCWDARKMASEKDVRHEQQKSDIPSFRWDYRWERYPAEGKLVEHPRDGSISTYRGHSVMTTLCRAYWSPKETTGQRYIYTGSASGDIVMYDVVSCEQVSRLKHHDDIVRDCSWHPFLPLLVSVSFDGTVVSWEPDDVVRT